MNISRVIVDHGEMNALATLFGVSLPTVRSALRGKTFTKLAQSIREIALVRGGTRVIELNQDILQPNKRQKKYR